MKNQAAVLLLFLLLPLIAYSQGFDSDYKAYSGDFNNDGYTDFYIKNPVPLFVPIINDDITFFIPVNQVDPQEIVLKQNHDGSFTIDSTLTSTDKQTLAQWPESSIELVLADFNVDGVLDVLLKGIPSVISYSFDQIVFSSPTEGQSPQVVTAVDEGFQKFFEEIYNWILNPNYFEENAPVNTEYGWTSTFVYNAFSWCLEYGEYNSVDYPASPYTIDASYEDAIADLNVGAAVCLSWGLEPIYQNYLLIHKGTITTKDYSVFNQEAYASSDTLDSIFSGGISLATYNEVLNLTQNMSTILGVDVPLGELNDCSAAPVIKNLVALAPAIPACAEFLSLFINTIGIILLDVDFSDIEEPIELIYRVYGGLVGMQGKSWTPTFPLSVRDYRDGAGLPEVNACTKIVFGRLLSDENMLRRDAKAISNDPPGYYVTGGRVMEYRFLFDAQVDVQAGQVEYGQIIDFSPPC